MKQENYLTEKFKEMALSEETMNLIRGGDNPPPPDDPDKPEGK